LLTTCIKLKDLGINGKFQTTKHTTIMEQLRIKADRFRKQGRLQEDNLEQIIEDMKAEGQVEEGKVGDGETTADIELKQVKEAVGEGLLRVHGITPNTKQPGIFQLMCENCNGFNN
jgi:hypothetical protein